MPTTRTKQTLTLEAANAVVEAAKAEAQSLGKAMDIAVTDEAGHLLCFARMDNAPIMSIDIAIDKAYTAATFGIPTHVWHDFIKDDPPLRDGAPSGIKRLVVFGGGYPITVDGQVVGAIGVSGGHYSEDQKVAEAGLAALG
jgi:uncharacterized protein GlcG (DUF336 family)